MGLGPGPAAELVMAENYGMGGLGAVCHARPTPEAPRLVLAPVAWHTGGPSVAGAAGADNPFSQDGNVHPLGSDADRCRYRGATHGYR